MKEVIAAGDVASTDNKKKSRLLLWRLLPIYGSCCIPKREAKAGSDGETESTIETTVYPQTSNDEP